MERKAFEVYPNHSSHMVSQRFIEMGKHGPDPLHNPLEKKKMIPFNLDTPPLDYRYVAKLGNKIK
jgi:hypothetical protein